MNRARFLALLLAGSLSISLYCGAHVLGALARWLETLADLIERTVADDGDMP